MASERGAWSTRVFVTQSPRCPTTTTTLCTGSSASASSTCRIMGRPHNRCSGFGRDERIRVPSPAASTTAESGLVSMRFSLSPDDGGDSALHDDLDCTRRAAEHALPRPMPLLTSSIDPGSDTYRHNRAAMESALAEVEEQLAVARGGGGQRYVARHLSRGKMLAHDRVEMLLDRDSPFLEIAPLAAWGTDYTVGASLVSGIGVVSGVECLVSANDPTVRGGATNPFTMRKSSRLADIALENRLPSISLVESGGADLPTQSEIFIPGGRGFRDLTQRSAAALPTIALVFGNSTAGGAYVPGMSDHIVMIDGRSKVFLGGPPLVKMATGEESDDEELGGAEMHSRISGLSDYFATDELDCIRIGRQIVADLHWRKLGPRPASTPDEPLADPDELLGVVSADLRVPFD